MIRATTFIPGSGEYDDLVYCERISRDRGLVVLSQDLSPTKSPRGRRLLLSAYREIISKYLSFGKIEHPSVLAVRLAGVLDELSRSLDCRVEDFRELRFYVLLHDGNDCYLLASKEGTALMGVSGQYQDVSSPDVPGATRLRAGSAGSQPGLFPLHLSDFLSLYRIQTSRGGSLGMILGGVRKEADLAIEALNRVDTDKGDPEKPDIPLEGLANRVLHVQIDSPASARLPLVQKPFSPRRQKSRTFVFSAVSMLFFVTLAVIWLSERLSGDHTSAGGTEVTASRPTGAENAAGSSTEKADLPELSVSPTAPATESEKTADSLSVRFSVAWDRSYPRPVTSSPLVESTTVVFGGRDGRLYALDKSSGEIRWRYRAADGIGASPACSFDRVIAADYRGNVFAVGLGDGNLLWNRKLPQKVISSPVVAGGEVLVGNYDGRAYALSVETGRVLWQVKTGGPIRGTPAYSSGRFYIPSYDQKLYAVSAGTGTIRWTYHIGGSVSSSPGAEKTRVVVGGVNGGVYCLDSETGALLWKFDAGAAVKSFVLLENGKVYAGSNDTSIYCLDAGTGGLIWKYKTGGMVFCRPAVFDRYLVFASYDQYVYCLDAETGEEIDKFKTNGPVFSSPVVDGERIYIGNNAGKFFCLNYLHKETS